MRAGVGRNAMSEEDQTPERLNRRNLLKSIGVAGVTTTGVPMISSATNYKPSDEKAREVLEDPKVQSIREVVNGLEIQKLTKKDVKVSDITITGTWIETNLGTLLHAESESGKTEARLDVVDLSEESSIRQYLPKEFRSVPEESEIWIRGHESSVSMLRMATKKEEMKIEQVIPRSAEVYSVAYDSKIDAFLVATGSKRDHEVTHRVEAKGEDRAVPSDNVEVLLTTQGCGTACAACVASVIAKGLCYYSCYQTAGLTCLICIANTNVALPLACNRCFEQCGIQA